MDCEEFSRLLDNYENLTIEEKIALCEHSASCEKCRAELEFSMAVTDTVRTLPRLEVPSDFMLKLNKRIDSEERIQNKLLKHLSANWQKYSTVAACLALVAVVGFNGKSLVDKMNGLDNGVIYETSSERLPADNGTDAVPSSVPAATSAPKAAAASDKTAAADSASSEERGTAATAAPTSGGSASSNSGSASSGRTSSASGGQSASSGRTSASSSASGTSSGTSSSTSSGSGSSANIHRSYSNSYGSSGSAGTAGSTGSTGSTGSAGSTGSTGATGSTGSTGSYGSDLSGSESSGTSASGSGSYSASEYIPEAAAEPTAQTAESAAAESSETQSGSESAAEQESETVSIPRERYVMSQDADSTGDEYADAGIEAEDTGYSIADSESDTTAVNTEGSPIPDQNSLVLDGLLLIKEADYDAACGMIDNYISSAYGSCYMITPDNLSDLCSAMQNEGIEFENSISADRSQIAFRVIKY